MNTKLNEEQTMLKDMANHFAEHEIIPVARELEHNHDFPKELIKKMAELGIMGMSVPQEYGGIKTDTLSMALVIEEISRALPALAVVFSVHSSLFCYSINEFGTHEQKKKYLPLAAQAKILGAFSLSEPEAGSDATALKTTCEKKGDGYLINGIKSWVTNGQNADAFILFAKPKGKSNKNKMNAFIVEKNFPGLEISKIEDKMGLHSSLTTEITLDNCPVPSSTLLGEEGQGAQIAFRCLDYSRIGIAAQSVGLARRCLEEAVKYSHQRQAFGKNISSFQAIQFKIADMATHLDAARLLTYRAADYSDKNQPFSKESAMAKLFASETANKTAYEALQIHGGYGYSKEFYIEQLYRDARVLSLYEGTSEIQRIIISRHLLK
ncbi:MAG: acyl-CoA dehydrogenase [Candidatus Aminicenantes bacterium]|nr:acyl-CoA dehydrogenase [Candidatus Aminicenantes bacterium]